MVVSSSRIQSYMGITFFWDVFDILIAVFLMNSNNNISVPLFYPLMRIFDCSKTGAGKWL